MIVRADGGADVARAIGFALDNDLEIAVRGGSHHQTGAAMVDNGLVVNPEDTDDISVDPEERVAGVGPGVSIEDVLAETQEYGLATPTGSAGDAGVSGTTPGGGIGWIRRKHGLSVDARPNSAIVRRTGRGGR